jgi:putative MATE family efflux protein
MKGYSIFFLYLCISESYQIPNIKRHIYPRDTSIKKLDDSIAKITKPATMNFIMNPIVGLVDGYWVSKMGDSTQLAGQASSEQLFNLYYTFFAFAPYVLTPIISRYHGENRKDKVVEFVNTAILLSLGLGAFASTSLFVYSKVALNTMMDTNSPVFTYANVYFRYRVIGLPFQLLNSCYYSIFRGKMDVSKGVKINILGQLVNIVLDPFFMKQYGIRGVAIASSIADMVSTICYTLLLLKEKYITIHCRSFVKNTLYMMKRAFFVQLKHLSYEGLYFTVNQRLLLLDSLGKISVAHVLLTKYFYFNSILFYSLGSAAIVIIPYQKVLNQNTTLTSNRLLYWGIIGSLVQISFLSIGKNIFGFLTSDPKVIEYIQKVLPIMGIIIPLNAISTVLDGILQGSNHYKIQFVNALTSFTIIVALSRYFTNLSQIWISFSVLSLIRGLRNYKKYLELL